jgi:hypothetical protein
LTFTHSIGAGVRIRFTAKPDSRIRDMLKANGFRWSPAAGDWWRTRVQGAADFLAALDRAMGPRRPDGPCWRCQAPEGYFRPHGAATPVYCDACHSPQPQSMNQASSAIRASSAEDREPDRSDLDYEDRCREACGL